MKRTLTFLSAAIFASAMALPAFAQVGAGIAGNGSVGAPSMQAGANADVSNSDAERVAPQAATSNPLHTRSDSTNANANSTRGTGANAGLGANVGGLGANVGAGANAGNNNNATGGY
jgi:hypothetical protein